MKLNITTFTAFLFSAMVLGGCNFVDDFLSAEPSKSTKKTIQTADQLDAVLARHAGFYEEQCDMMMASDDYAITPEIHNAQSSGYNITIVNYALWNDENPDTRYNTWGAEYTKIYYANLVLNNIDNVEGDEVQKANLKAEAYLLRAYSFFQIALAHTLYYTGSNGDEPGITLKTSTSFEQSSARANLKDTWDAIEADLQEALKITQPLVGSDGVMKNWRGNTAAAKGFAARYYLYRADYEKAQQYAQAALSEYSKMKDFNDPSEMYNHSHVDSYKLTDTGETVTVQFPYTYPQSDFSYIMGWSELLYTRTCYSAFWWFIPSQALIDNYSVDVPGGNPDNDLRYHFFLLPDFGLRSCAKTTAGRQPGYCQFFYDHIVSGPTTAEMNLILAECAARSSNWSNAMSYVNKVRRNRIKADVYTDLTASSQADAIKKVLQERRREMPFSIRWYDLKRLNANDSANQVTVTKTFYPFNSTTVQKGEPTKTYTLAPNGRHYAIPISNDEISKSYNEIVQNTY